MTHLRKKIEKQCDWIAGKIVSDNLEHIQKLYLAGLINNEEADILETYNLDIQEAVQAVTEKYMEKIND